MSLQAFKRNYLQHALAVGEWLQAHQATGTVDAQSLQLTVQRGGKSLEIGRAHV